MVGCTSSSLPSDVPLPWHSTSGLSPSCSIGCETRHLSPSISYPTAGWSPWLLLHAPSVLQGSILLLASSPLQASCLFSTLSSPSRLGWTATDVEFSVNPWLSISCGWVSISLLPSGTLSVPLILLVSKPPSFSPRLGPLLGFPNLSNSSFVVVSYKEPAHICIIQVYIWK